MIISSKAGFVFFASTKSASTAIEAALAPHADMTILNPPEAKHIGVQAFERHILPVTRKFGFGVLERLAVIRNPRDWVASWYAYRARPDLDGHPRSTAGLSFDQFVDGVLADPIPEFAKIGRPGRMLRRASGALGIDRLYAYEALPQLAAYFSERLGVPIDFSTRMNPSPPRPTQLSPDREARLRAALADDFALYEAAIRG